MNKKIRHIYRNQVSTSKIITLMLYVFAISFFILQFYISSNSPSYGTQVMAFKAVSPPELPSVNEDDSNNVNTLTKPSTFPTIVPNSSSTGLGSNSSSFSTSQINNNANSTQSLFLSYKNSEHDFSIKYPYKWKIIEGDRIPGAHIEGVETVVAFVPPGELATSNGYTAFLEVLVDQNAKGLDLEEYLSENVQDIMKDKSLSNLTLDKANTDGLLSGRPAYVMSYSVDKPGVSGSPQVITKEIGTKVGDDIYFIVYIAYKDRVDKYFEEAQQMVDSFRLFVDDDDPNQR